MAKRKRSNEDFIKSLDVRTIQQICREYVNNSWVTAEDLACIHNVPDMTRLFDYAIINRLISDQTAKAIARKSYKNQLRHAKTNRPANSSGFSHHYEKAFTLRGYKDQIDDLLAQFNALSYKISGLEEEISSLDDILSEYYEFSEYDDYPKEKRFRIIGSISNLENELTALMNQREYIYQQLKVVKCQLSKEALPKSLSIWKSKLQKLIDQAQNTPG